MKIAIDLRSLQSGKLSGVENYTLNLLEHMLPQDKNNRYLLFSNSFKKSYFPELHFINSEIKIARWPNKFLNLALKIGLFKLEKIFGQMDCLLLPNLNQFGIFPRTKLAITVHDLSPMILPEFYDIKRRIWHRFLNYRRAFERADLIFAVSEFTKQDLVRLFAVPERKIKVVYPGIDKKIFHPSLPETYLRQTRNQLGLPGDYILFLNTIEPRKNLQNLIRAFETMDSPCYLVIAGRRGWKHGPIFRQIASSSKARKIKYLGYVPEQQKPALIKLAKVLVYPSFYEGFGFQPLEAMALGVPTVVSQVSALSEVCGDAALLVDPYSPLSIASAIDMVLNNQNFRQQLIAKGLTRADFFNWDESANKILTAINSL